RAVRDRARPPRFQAAIQALRRGPQSGLSCVVRTMTAASWLTRADSRTLSKPSLSTYWMTVGTTASVGPADSFRDGAVRQLTTPRQAASTSAAHAARLNQRLMALPPRAILPTLPRRRVPPGQVLGPDHRIAPSCHPGTDLSRATLS